MKNIFKMMGVALLACSMMMVSCGKDEEEENNNNQNNNNTETTDVFKVNFNGNEWSVAKDIFLHTSRGANTLDENYMILYGFKSAADYDAMLSDNAPSNPYIDGTMMTVTGNYTYQTSGGDYLTYNDPTDTYYYEGDDQNDPGDYLRWNAISASFTENITAVDLTARTISAVATCEHFDLEQYAAAGGTSYGTTQLMTVTLQNHGWTWYEDMQ